MDLVQVGQIVNTHGIKGEIKVMPLTDNIERFTDKVDFYIGDEQKKVAITNVRIQKGMVYLKLEGYDDINQVIPFKGKYICVSYEDRYQLPKDSYYISDLIGLSIKDQDGVIIGELKDIIQLSGNDIYVVKDEEGKEIMIPAVKEFILDVDMESKAITVRLIEGMR